ncbi:MAG: hypothetical protein IAF94_08330 [Pirellulaceae bacterium]|nr:hypothetical protein [Pirellulaceae bacterium]
MSKPVAYTEFGQLRNRARDLRDKRIGYARREYELTLVTIAKLEQDLTGKYSSRRKKISACIESVIPTEREFTTVDILAGLEALEPGRNWRKRSVDCHLSRLRQRGLIRRLKRHKNNEPAIYVRAGLKVPELPFQDMTLAEVVEQVLVRPMTQTELVIVMLEAGYESGMNKSYLRNAVGSLLRTSPVYRNVRGKWSKAQ